MKRAYPLLLLASVLSLGACSTFEGLKNDLSSGYNAVAGGIAQMSDPQEEKKKLPVYDGSCPPAFVRNDLTRLVEFTDPGKPSEATKISEVEIHGLTNTCRTENGSVVMQLDISLYGTTGPKARLKPGDKPSFAYPYFVAVTDENGTVVSKEIFAVSLAYTADQKDINQTESVFQTMPYADVAAGKSYNVIVGLQLTPEQLAYNQSQTKTAN